MLTYKFLSPDRATYFSDGLLRATPPSAMNDPFECVPVLSLEESHAVVEQYIEMKRAEILNDVINGRGSRPGAYEEFEQWERGIRNDLVANPAKLRDFFFERGVKNLDAKIGLLCLSRRWDNALMWAHYAASHSGFCVGFDRTHAFFNSESADERLRDVVYSAQRVRVPLTQGTPIDFEVMFTKSRDWEYEHEERQLLLLSQASVTVPRSPYPIHLFSVPLDAVREIILGARAATPVVDAVRQFCAHHSPAVFRAEVSSATFDMERVPHKP